MSTDLWILVAVAMLAPLLTMPVAVARGQLANGLPWGLGNRDKPLEGAPAWEGRAVRAHLNLLENLPTYATLVLVAHVTGATNDITAIGGMIFLITRILHAAVYIAGITHVRTALFGISQLGPLLYLWQIIAHGGTGY